MAQPVGQTGTIDVAGLALTVTPLSIAEEAALYDRFKRAAENPYQRIAGMLAAAAPEDRAEMVREAVRLHEAYGGAGPAAVEEYRRTPAGVAAELHARCKKATPGLTEAGLAAVVTAANAGEAFAALQAVISPPKASATPSTSPG